MKALQFRRNLPRYAAARLAGGFIPGRGASAGPLSLVDMDPPTAPGPDWVRVRPRLSGICGSDLATVDGRSARYFEPRSLSHSFRATRWSATWTTAPGWSWNRCWAA